MHRITVPGRRVKPAQDQTPFQQLATNPGQFGAERAAQVQAFGGAVKSLATAFRGGTPLPDTNSAPDQSVRPVAERTLLTGAGPDDVPTLAKPAPAPKPASPADPLFQQQVRTTDAMAKKAASEFAAQERAEVTAFQATEDRLGLPGEERIASLTQAREKIGAALPPAARLVFFDITATRLTRFDTKIALLDASKSVGFQRKQLDSRMTDLGRDAIDTPGRLETIETEITAELVNAVATGLIPAKEFDATLNTRISTARRIATAELLDIAPEGLLERVGTDMGSELTGLNLDEPSRAAISARAQAKIAKRAAAAELAAVTQENDVSKQLHINQKDGKLTASMVAMCYGKCNPETLKIFAERDDGVVGEDEGGTASDILGQNTGGIMTVGFDEAPETGPRFPGFAGITRGENGQDFIIINLPGTRGPILVPISRVDANNFELEFGDLSGAVPAPSITGTLGFNEMGEPVINLSPVDQKVFGRKTRPATQAELGILAGLPPSAQRPQDSLGPLDDAGGNPFHPTLTTKDVGQVIRENVIEPVENLGRGMAEGMTAVREALEVANDDRIDPRALVENLDNPLAVFDSENLDEDLRTSFEDFEILRQGERDTFVFLNTLDNPRQTPEELDALNDRLKVAGLGITAAVGAGMLFGGPVGGLIAGSVILFSLGATLIIGNARLDALAEKSAEERERLDTAVTFWRGIVSDDGMDLRDIVQFDIGDGVLISYDQMLARSGNFGRFVNDISSGAQSDLVNAAAGNVLVDPEFTENFRLSPDNPVITITPEELDAAFGEMNGLLGDFASAYLNSFDGFMGDLDRLVRVRSLPQVIGTLEELDRQLNLMEQSFPENELLRQAVQEQFSDVRQEVSNRLIVARARFGRNIGFFEQINENRIAGERDDDQ